MSPQFLVSFLCLVLVVHMGCDKKKPKLAPPDARKVEKVEPKKVEKITPKKVEKANVKEPQKTSNIIPNKKGDIEVTALGHGSVLLTWRGKNIYVDPVSKSLGEGKTHPKADVILVTHIHGDHFDLAAIAKLRGDKTRLLAPASVAKKGGKALGKVTIMANGDKKNIGGPGALNVEAVAMYNLVRKRDNGAFFHPKGRGNGYVVTMADTTRIYFSGDTECTPEMKALKDIDAAFVCMNLPYTMPVEEAATCVKAFKPKILFPYHYRGQDPSTLKGLVNEDGVDIRMLSWYPKHDHKIEEK